MSMKTARQKVLAGACGLLILSAAVATGLPAPNPLRVENQLPQPAPPRPGTAGPRSVPAELSLEERADIFMARKAYADATDFYHRALKKTGYTDAGLWNKLGIAYQQQMNYRAARNAYNQSIRRRKDYAAAWNNLGTVYFLENRYRKSLKQYERAVKLEPNSAPLHLNLGAAYNYLKKYPEAIEEYRAALQIDPNCLTEHSATGTIVQARGGDVEFYYYLAKVFASLGRSEEAVRYLRRAFEDGFKDHKKLQEDPDFQKISQTPAYVELMKNPPVPIRD